MRGQRDANLPAQGKPPERRAAWFSIRWKYALVLLLVSLLPLGGYAMWNAAEERRELLSLTEQRLLALARRTAEAIETYLDERRRDAQRYAQGPAFDPFLAPGATPTEADRRRLQAVLDAHRRTYGYLRIALLTASGGVAFAVGEPVPTGHAVSQRALRGALAGALTVSDPFFAGPDGPYVLEVAAPMLDAAGHPRGALLLALPFARIEAMVKSDNDRGGMRTLGALFDEHMIRLTHGLDPALQGRPLGPLPADVLKALVAERRFGRRTPELLASHTGLASAAEHLAALRRGEPGPPYLDALPAATGQKSRVAVAFLRTKPWTYGLAAPYEAFMAPVAAQTRRALATLLAAAAAALLLAVAFGGLMARRLARLAQASSRLAAGDFAARADPGPADEVGRVAERLNAMAGTLQEHEAASRERIARLEALIAVGRSVTSSLEVDEVLSLVVEKSLPTVGADAAAILTPGPTHSTTHVVKAYGLSAEFLSGFILEPGLRLAGAALHEGRPALSEDVQADPRISLPESRLLRVKAEGIRAVLALPIPAPGGPYGVLVIYRRQARAFDAHEVRIGTLLAGYAGIAIENARLFEQEQARRRQVEAVRAVTQELARELNLRALLDLIHRRAAELVGATSGVVHLWDEEAQTLVPQAWHGYGEYMKELRLRLGEGICGTVAQRREGMIVNDYRSSPYALPLFLEHTAVAAAVAEPLLYRERLLGVILLSKEGPGQGFTAQDQEVLTLFAAQAAIAIENARLFQQEQERRQQLEAVRAVTQQIARELDLPAVLAAIHRHATELVGGASGVVFLWDESAQVLVPQAWHGLGEWVRGIRLRLGEGCPGIAAQRRAGMIVNDHQHSPHRHPALLDWTQIAATLAEPLLSHDRLLGVVTVNRHQGARPFTRREEEILALFADQAAIAIENARLFARAEAARAAARESGERLRALAARLQAAREEERKQIAREVHDELGQALTGLKMDVAWLATHQGPGREASRETLGGMGTLIDGAIQTVRRIATELRPAVLDAFGLEAAIEWQLKEFQRRTGIRCALTSRLDDRPLGTERSVAVFRILQETLTNVARHAGATAVAVRLDVEDDHLLLEVRDDGRGIAPAELNDPKALGVLGMRERALAFGGELVINGEPWQGTTVVLGMPLGAEGSAPEAR